MKGFFHVYKSEYQNVLNIHNIANPALRWKVKKDGI